MKKLLVFFMLAFMPLILFAQLPEPPADAVGFADWFKSAFLTWPGALAAILVITEKVKRQVNVKGVWAVVISWSIALPVVAVAWALQIGFLSGVTVWVALIYAVSFSLAANLAYLTPVIKEGVRLLVDYIDKRKLAKRNNK